MNTTAATKIPPGERFLRMPELEHRTGISRPQIYALIAKGEFPRQVKLTTGGKIAGWLNSEITEYMQSRVSQRQPEGLEDL